MSITQRLRDLFWDIDAGQELHDELDAIERYFGVAVTTSNRWGTMPAERIAVLEAEEAATVAAEARQKEGDERRDRDPKYLGRVTTDDDAEADLAEAWSSGYWHGLDHTGPMNQAAIDKKNPHWSGNSSEGEEIHLRAGLNADSTDDRGAEPNDLDETQ